MTNSDLDPNIPHRPTELGAFATKAGFVATRKLFAIVLIATGLLWALAQLANIGFSSQFWPMFIIIPGLLILLFANTIEEGSWASALGAVVLATGLLLAYQSVFDHFESWAYAWALVSPGAIGAGLLIHAKRFDAKPRAALAITLISSGAVLFVVGAVFFEVLINISGRSNFDGRINGYVVPAALVGIGLIVLLTRAKD